MRKVALEMVRRYPTKDVINAHEMALLHWDGDLKGEFEKAKSLFGFLGLERFEAVGFQSLIDMVLYLVLPLLLRPPSAQSLNSL